MSANTDDNVPRYIAIVHVVITWTETFFGYREDYTASTARP